MKRFKKSIILGSFICLVLCLTGVSLHAAGFSITSVFLTAKSQGLNDAIFERNGEICYFDYSDKSITVLSKDGKYSPVLSPDKTKILYRNSVLETENNVMKFGIIDINGEQMQEIVIDSEFSNDILDCQWLSDTTVGITTHVNPSTSEYFVYDITSGEKTGYYVGYAFAQIPNTEKIIYARNVPHWSDEPVYHSFIVDEKTVYTSDVLGAKLYPPAFSKDLKKIAFIEDLPESSDTKEAKVTQRIITADFDDSNLKLQNIRSIKVTPEIAGYLTFDENNNICVVNSNLLLKYDEKKSSFIQYKITTDLRDSARDSKNFAELQTAITKYWGDDSLEKINSINWTSEETR
jgi:hypothetical protein